MIPKGGAKLEKKLIFSFKNDNNLVNFDPSTKKSKTFALWLVPTKYKTFDLKKYRRVIFHESEESCKIWRKIDLWFGKFSSEHLKVSKLVFSWDPFVQSRKCMSYKLTEEL